MGAEALPLVRRDQGAAMGSAVAEPVKVQLQAGPLREVRAVAVWPVAAGVMRLAARGLLASAGRGVMVLVLTERFTRERRGVLARLPIKTAAAARVLPETQAAVRAVWAAAVAGLTLVAAPGFFTCFIEL